jgi:hypothetical protein
MSEARVQDQATKATRLSFVWGGLPSDHRRYLFWQAIVGAAIVNLVLNAGIAWLSTLNEHEVPRWAVPFVDRPSTITDTIGTFFILPLVTCLIFTTLAHREMREGKLEPLRWTRATHPFLRRLPAGMLRRGLAAGAITTVILGPLAVLAIIALDVGDLTIGEFVAYKAVLGVALGLFVTPILALWAIAEGPPDAKAEPPVGPSN